MTTIKLLLLGALGLVGLQAIRGRSRPIHKVLWRAFVMVVLVSGALAVLFPDALTSIANRVGVGRGADLLLYGLSVTVMLMAVVLFRRLSDLERRYTQLARRIALDAADRVPPSEDP